MARRASLQWLAIAVAVLGMARPAQAARPEEGITWLGHAAFRVARAGRVVYIDPWRIAGAPGDADLVLITHPHFDHLSPPDIAKVSRAGTVIVGPPDCLADLPGDRRPVAPGDRLEVGGVTVEAVPAYNTTTAFHPKGNRWVGYVVTLGKTRIYHAGDTDVIPEMQGLGVEVALLPVSGTYVMTAEQAAAAAGLIGPTLAVPMHYGTIIGSEQEARRFAERCAPIRVKIFSRPGSDARLGSAPVARLAVETGAQAEGPPSEITVSSAVDKVRLTVDEPLMFSVTIAGPITSTPRVSITSLEGFQVISTGQSQQVHLRGGQMQLAITLQYLLAPTTVGSQTLGPVVVEHEGHRYQTAPLTVEVLPGAAPPAPPAPSAPRRPAIRGGTVL